MKPTAKSSGFDKDSLRNPVVVACSAILLFFISQIVGVTIAGLVTPYIKNETYQLLIIIICNCLTLLGLVTVTMRTFKFTPRAIGWSKPKAKTFLLIVPAFLVYFVVSSVLTVLATKFIPGFKVDQAQDVGFNNLKQPLELVAGFISLSILTPIFEETIFRGVLFKGLRRRLPFWVSAVITSIVFAVAHLQWNVAIDVFALSLVLCYLAEKSGSIAPGILLHGLKNTLAFALLFIYK